MSDRIPDFQTLMLPFLKLISDGKQYHINEIQQKLSDEFNLTEEEREALLPSGRDKIMRNRVGWTRTYLKKAGLIFSPQRGSLIITEEGRKVLASNPKRIDVAYLKKMPAFIEWVNSYTDQTSLFSFDDLDAIPDAELKDITVTPFELIDSAYQQTIESLSFELLERVKTLNDKQFERLVLKVLAAMGYGEFRDDATEHIGKPNDGGVDGLIKEDKLGLGVIYVQAKQYRDTAVPISHIRDFAGSLLSKKAKKGVFITLSTFPNTAYDYVNSIEHKIVLINGKGLAKFMIDYNVGVTLKRTIELKDLDNDFFDEL
jgi:restriction system protein